MDDFNTIRLKRKAVEKFKSFSKKISPSYSETLEYMIAFFNDNDLSPYDILGESMTSSTNRINKRLDVVISIFRNVEETQLKPTKKMLESLFEEIEEEQQLLIEKASFEGPVLITENEELTYYRNEYLKINAKLRAFKQDYKETLGSFKIVKNPFGANHYLSKLTLDEYKTLKDKLPHAAL